MTKNVELTRPPISVKPSDSQKGSLSASGSSPTTTTRIWSAVSRLNSRVGHAWNHEGGAMVTLGGFVAGLEPDGALAYATYLGGSADDRVIDVVLHR